MNHLGLLYLEQENYEEAEIYFEKTYDILCTNDKEYGKDHAITLETMKNLGITYVGLEKFYDAEQLFVDCFRREEIRLKNLLPNNNNNSNTTNSTETTVVVVNPQRRFSNNRLSEGKEPDLSTRESIAGSESSRKGGRRGSESKLNETKEEANDRISLSEMKEAIDYNESKNEGNNNRNNNKNNNNHPEMIRLSVINILDVLQQLNLIYQEEHRYLEAISINQDYLRIYRQYYSVLFPFYYHSSSSSSSSQGKDHHHHETDLIKVYLSLGKLYFLQNQYDKCEQIMKECLMKQKQLQLEFFQQQQQQGQGQGQGQGQQSKSNILRNSYNQTTMTSTTNNSYSNQDDDESMLITYELLSDVLEKQGNWMECLQFTKEWMNKIKKVHGGKTYELVTPYERLLAMYKQLNKTDEELALYPEMIDRFKKVFDYEATPLNSARSESTSATTATTSNTTAAAAASLHRQQRRQSQQQQQQQEDLLPELDNETRYYLKKLNSLMKSYAILLSSDRIQKYEQAEQYYKECFQIEKNRLYGSDHLETMETLYQLAYLTAIQGKYREGEIILKKSLEKSLKLFGENHEFTMKLKKTMNEFHEFRESEEKRNGKCIIS
jgi:hypothetical protein